MDFHDLFEIRILESQGFIEGSLFLHVEMLGKRGIVSYFVYKFNLN